MTLHFDFHRHERIWIDDTQWSVDQRTPTGILALGVGDGFPKQFTTDELAKAFEDGRLVRTPRETHVAPSQDFAAMSLTARGIAMNRQRLIDEITRLLGPPPHSDPDLERVLSLASTTAGFDKIVPLSTARRWLARAERAAGDILGLVPDKPGTSGSRLPANVDLLIQDVIDDRIMARPPMTGDAAYNDLCIRIEAENAKRIQEAKSFGLEPTGIISAPSKRTFYRRIEAQDDALRLRKQQGQAASDSMYKKVNPGPIEDIPYGMVDIDHTLVDVIVVNEDGVPIGRPWLSVAVDRCTRMCCGFILTFESPSAATVLLLLKSIILGKGTFLARYPNVKNSWPCFGLPRGIGNDNAVEFHAEDYCEPLRELGIDPQYYPTAAPAYKGGTERFFGTLNTGLFHMLPGTTLSKPNRKKDRDPATFAKVSQERLTELLTIFIVDVYHQRPHRTLKVAPIKRWEDKTAEHPIRLPPSRRAVDLALLGRDTRTIQRQGVELYGFFYQSKEIQRLRLENKGKGKYEIRHDDLDLGVIYVHDKKRGVFVTADSVLPEAKGMTKWQRKAILADLGANAGGATVEEVRKSREKIRELAAQTLAEGRKTTRKIGNTKKAARTLAPPPTHHGGAPKPNSRPSVPATPAPTVSAPKPHWVAGPSVDLDQAAANAGIRVRKGAF